MFWFEGLWQPAFSAWGSPVTWAELLALVLSLWMVERNIRVSTLAWPLAIASAVLYYFVFRFSGLYGEAALQWMFVGISVWGWWQWRRGQQQQAAALRVRVFVKPWAVDLGRSDSDCMAAAGCLACSTHRQHGAVLGRPGHRRQRRRPVAAGAQAH